MGRLQKLPRAALRTLRTRARLLSTALCSFLMHACWLHRLIASSVPVRLTWIAPLDGGKPPHNAKKPFTSACAGSKSDGTDRNRGRRVHGVYPFRGGAPAQ